MEETQKQQLYEIDDFQNLCHLWSIVPGGNGKGILLLRKLVDAIQANNYSRPGNRLPSILIVGKGKQLVAKALVNSLAIVDARFCHAKYLDNGIGSSQFFNDSIASTAHIISHIEKLTPMSESVLWRYLVNGCCNYFNFASRKYDMILHCNGLIVLTAQDIESVSEPIIKAVDHTIELEPLSTDQLEIVVHQQLKFCGIEYEGEEVLQAIVGNDLDSIRPIMQFLKTCLVVMRAEHEDVLTVEIVEKARRLME